MLPTAQGKTAPALHQRATESESGSFLTRRVWLPKIIYDALPYFYVMAGISAFLATLFISEWFWVVPHYLLFSLACVHFGLFIFKRRRKGKPDDA
ncbi:MAG: hypothetical protein KJO56_04890 [Gammaproteobacteria bacterium]|nr:hypothetical protein [Gammaproteobacteria bacterium]MBT8106228.1 hypothetical protein [Gammaproteobacteria bacterium]NNK26242.1 hypothetical protein [Woeseiaceae bacterium]